MKVFITGGSGLLGQYLNVELSKSHQILTQYNSNIGNCGEFKNVQMDLTDFDSLSRIFIEYKPDAVIHTAAVSDPSLAYKIGPRKVYSINVTITESVAQLCDKFGSKLIYTSTDLVYAGYRGSMLKEDAKLIPASLYAETKLMGEVKIQNTFNDYIILRTALLYGFGLNHSDCHFHSMYKNLKQGKEVNLFVDQFRSPLSLFDSARIIKEILDKDIKSEIINFGGTERLSRYGLGKNLCEIAGFDKNLLLKIKMDDVPEVIKVEDVSMNTEKLQSFGVKQRSISDSIKEILKNA